MSTYLFMVLAEETSVMDDLGVGTAPTVAQITAAFRDVQDPPAIRFVGPGPRVTRVWNALRGTVTRAAQPVKVDDPTLTESEAREIVANRLFARLERAWVLRSWRPVQVVPYNSAVSGPLSFWESGAAVRAPTMDSAPSVFSTTPSDNPVGPNDPQLRPMGVGESLEEWAHRVGSGAAGLAPLLWIGAGLLGLIYLAPAAFRLTGRAVDSVGRSESSLRPGLPRPRQRSSQSGSTRPRTAPALPSGRVRKNPG